MSPVQTQTRIKTKNSISKTTEPLAAHEQIARRDGALTQLTNLSTVARLFEVQRHVEAQPLLERALIRVPHELEPREPRGLRRAELEAERRLVFRQMLLEVLGQPRPRADTLARRGDGPLAKGAKAIDGVSSAIALREKELRHGRQPHGARSKLIIVIKPTSAPVVFTAPDVFTVPFGSVKASEVTFEAAEVQIRT